MKIGKYTIEIKHDFDFIGWENHLFDEPVQIVFKEYRFGQHVVFDNMPSDIPFEIWSNVESENWQEIAESLCYCSDERASDKIVIYPYWHDHAVTFKSWRNAACGMFFREYGFDLSDVKVERFDTQSDAYFMIWRQSELDSYAGMKNAKPPSETVRAIIDGDIWGFTITDESGEYVDSCWGFVGDSDYCEQEAISIARSLVEQDKKERFARLKELIRNRVPLMYRQAELTL